MNDTGSVKRLRPDELKPGMVAALDVFCAQNETVVRANSLITQAIINRAASLNVDHVYVYTRPSEQAKRIVLSRDVEFRSDMVKNTLLTMRESGVVPKEELDKMVKDAIAIAERMGSVHQYLALLRDRNEYTFTHCISVSIMSNVFSKWLNLTVAEAEDLRLASSLHDIGKLSIDLNILDKPEKLTDDEYHAIQKHVELGMELLEISDVSERIKRAVSEHHEKVDGTGYPLGKKEDEISPYGAMLAVLDVYDALVSKRVYKAGLSPFQALGIMEKDRFRHYRYSILDTFQKNVLYSCVGHEAALSSGQRGEIVYINPFDVLRPYVRVEGGEIINLQAHPKTQVTEVKMS